MKIRAIFCLGIVLTCGAVFSSVYVERDAARIGRGPCVESLPWVGVLSTDGAFAPSPKWQVGVNTPGFRVWHDAIGKLGIRRYFIEINFKDIVWAETLVKTGRKDGLSPILGMFFSMPKDKDEARAALKDVETAAAKFGKDAVEWSIGLRGVGEGAENLKSAAKFAVLLVDALRKTVPNAIVTVVPQIPTRESTYGAFARALKEVGADRFQAVGCANSTADPDEIDIWEVRDAVRDALPKAAFRQVATIPAPSEWQTRFGWIGRRSWTEFSQAKWMLRRMVADLGRNFGVVEIWNMADNREGRYGLLKTEPDVNETGAVRPKIAYYAVQHAVRLFNGDLRWDDANRRKVEVKDGRRFLFAAKDGSPVLTYWRQGHAREAPSDLDEVASTEIRLPNGPDEDAVLIDVLSGRVYAIPPERIRREGGFSVYSRLPIWDSPMVLCRRGLYPIVDCPLAAVERRTKAGSLGYEKANIETPWAERARAGEAWTSYPRPQLKRAAWENLNGLWDYAITDLAAGKPTAWQGKIRVPYPIESKLSGVGRPLDPDEQLWYRRIFAAKRVEGRRTILRFGAVDYRATVFVNGREATAVPHVGGVLPFSLDVTPFVKDGENELVVAVWDPTDDRRWGTQALGKQCLTPYNCFYQRCSGIWQTVWLEDVPTTHVEGYKVVTDITNGEVRFGFDVQGAGFWHGQVEILDGGKCVASKRFWRGGKVTVKMPDGYGKWSPKSPKLYDFRVTVTEGLFGAKDRAQGYFGMREVSVSKDKLGCPRFRLNGKPIYMHGLLDQGWWPDGVLTPPSEEALYFDTQLCLDQGFNTIRKHIKVEPAQFYRYCDEHGILVWQDAVTGRLRDTDPACRNGRYAEFRAELKGMVDYLQGFPSIVMWVPFNEGWGQPEEGRTNETIAWLKAYDSTRWCDGPSGWNDYGAGDTRDRHGYPAAKAFAQGDCNGRVSIIGEYGALQLPVGGHEYRKRTGKPLPPWKDAEPAALEKLDELMSNTARQIRDGLAADIYTMTVDTELGAGGLVTYDRRVVKHAHAAMKKIAVKFYDEAARAETALGYPADFTCSDPFIVRDDVAGVYRLFNNVRAQKLGDPLVETRTSKDLVEWSLPKTALTLPEKYKCSSIWAPEVHEWRGRWYMFATIYGKRDPNNLLPVLQPGFKPVESRRKTYLATWIFGAASPEGPYRPISQHAITPEDWSSLDGTLFVEDGKPYMVFCHEWTQVRDGTMEAVALTDDLTAPIGKPWTLFTASQLRKEDPEKYKRHVYVTDGPFLFRSKTGKLMMLWSTGGSGYTQNYSISESGRLAGPWNDHRFLLKESDCGHGMIFKTFDGRLALALHSPNEGHVKKRLRVLEIEDRGDSLKIGRQIGGLGEEKDWLKDDK